MRDSELESSVSAMTNQGSNYSAVLGNRYSESKGNTQVEIRGPKGPVVLITGDSFGIPPELGPLLRDCGCSTYVITDLKALKDTTHAGPDLIVVHFASVQAASPKRVQVLREKDSKPIVCLLPHPTEQQIARVDGLRADLLIFKPLCAEEFKSRFRLLLWARKVRKTFRYVDGDGKSSDLQFSDWDDSVVCSDNRVHLTRKEHALLILLASEPARVFSIDEIIRSVWSGAIRASAADVHQCVYSLRKKLEKDPRDPSWIITAPSYGYRFAGTREI